MRLALRARWPSRILGWVALADLVIAVGMFVLDPILAPPGTTWFLLAVLTGLALVVAGIVYLNTLRPVRAEERALMDAIEAELVAGRVAPAIETDEARALREAEAALEGEVARRRVEAARKSEPKPEKKARFALRRK
jgi:hypothetical protein